MPPRVLLVGASTGGPQALNRLLAQLNGVIDQAPVLVVQHMPPTFTTILAEHLARAVGRPAHEAVDGEEVRAGQIYIAPGGHHMRVMRRDGNPTIALEDGPLVNFCKPAVDPLFELGRGDLGLARISPSCSREWAPTARAARRRWSRPGGTVIAQDEESSVVWGMPGSVANAGLCSAVLPLDQIAPKIVRLFSGDRS